MTTTSTLDGPRGPIGWSEDGAGAPLLLLAGLGATRRLWGELPQLLGRHFRVVSPDNRGVGCSRGGAPFTLDGAADDLLLLLDHLGLERAHLLGVSMGGTIALATALRAPGRCDRLALLSCPAHLSQHGQRLLSLLRELMLCLPPERFGPALMRLAFAPPAHEQMAGFVDQAGSLYGLDRLDLPGALAQADHLLAGFDLRPRLAGLERPTLVLSGRRDAVVATEDTAAVAAAIPGATLVEVEAAGHSLLAEGGGAVLGRVVDFLARAGASR